MFLDETLKIVAALEQLGTRARSIDFGVLRADDLDEDKYKLVGRITRVDKLPLEAAIRVGALPILTLLAQSLPDQILNVDADIASGELTKELEPLTIVFHNDKGALWTLLVGPRPGACGILSSFNSVAGDPLVIASKQFNHHHHQYTQK
jgi:N-acetyl-gamma-glutamyl-phosphate reductase/acetylglutamate kinase